MRKQTSLAPTLVCPLSISPSVRLSDFHSNSLKVLTNRRYNIVVADMDEDKLADKKNILPDMVADMEVDMVADMLTVLKNEKKEYGEGPTPGMCSQLLSDKSDLKPFSNFLVIFGQISL